MMAHSVLRLALLCFAGLAASLHVSSRRTRTSPTLFAGFGSATSIAKSGNEAIMDGAASAPCPCKSGELYSKCCMPFHAEKEMPSTPTQMVRSRFSALALKLTPEYLIATTHPDHSEFVAPEQKSKMKAWIRGLNQFMQEFIFLDLIFDDESRDSAATLGNSSEGDKATVSFKAKMARTDVGERTPEFLTETSEFVHVKDAKGGRWLYRDAKVNSPFTKSMPVTEVANQRQKFITTAKRGVPRGN